MNFIAAILKFKMAPPVQSLNKRYFWFRDPENIGIDTKIRSLRALRAEIWSKVVN